MSCTSSR